VLVKLLRNIHKHTRDPHTQWRQKLRKDCYMVIWSTSSLLEQYSINFWPEGFCILSLTFRNILISPQKYEKISIWRIKQYYRMRCWRWWSMKSRKIDPQLDKFWMRLESTALRSKCNKLLTACLNPTRTRMRIINQTQWKSPHSLNWFPPQLNPYVKLKSKIQI
jgi:hypothetical protein